MLRTGGLHSPYESLTPRFDAQVSPNAGGLLQRALVPPLAGLPPASHRELPGRTLHHKERLGDGSGKESFVIPAKAGVQASHLLVRPLLHANVDPWMPDQVGHDDLGCLHQTVTLSMNRAGPIISMVGLAASMPRYPSMALA